MENVNCLRCRFRHKDNGNCTAVGGFCTAVPAAHCPLLREYLDGGQLMGKYITKKAALNTIFSEPPEAHYPSWYAERGLRRCQLPMLRRWRMGGGTQTKLAHCAERSQRKDWTQRSGTIGSLTTAPTVVQRWAERMAAKQSWIIYNKSKK